MWTNPDIPPSDTPRLAHALGAAGYQAALSGRMHWQRVDEWHGFGKLLVGHITPMYAHLPHPPPRRLPAGEGGNSRAAVTPAGPGRTACQAHHATVTEATVE